MCEEPDEFSKGLRESAARKDNETDNRRNFAAELEVRIEALLGEFKREDEDQDTIKSGHERQIDGVEDDVGVGSATGKGRMTERTFNRRAKKTKKAWITRGRWITEPTLSSTPNTPGVLS